MITCEKCGAQIDNSPEIKYCKNCGCQISKDKRTSANRNKIFVVVIISIILISALVIFSLGTVKNEAVKGEIEKIVDILYKSETEIINEYSNVYHENGNTLCYEGEFADMTGCYEICLLDDGTVWRIIFDPDSTSKDADMVVDAINSCLGTYEEYDYEWEQYRWVTDELELMYYVNERMYFDPM